MSSFRFPDGVDFLGEGDDDSAHFKVAIPTDADGFFGRECPQCHQHFRVALADYQHCPTTSTCGASTAAATASTASS